jgi:hypothetical protein
VEVLSAENPWRDALESAMYLADAPGKTLPEIMAEFGLKRGAARRALQTLVESGRCVKSMARRPDITGRMALIPVYDLVQP